MPRPQTSARTSKAGKAAGRAARARPAARDDQDLYGGLIRLHILHHAARAPIFGLWMIEELQHHGYQIGAGTLYPILHALESRGLLRSVTQREGRGLRRLYAATAEGRRTLKRAKRRVLELFGEIFEGESIPASRSHHARRRGSR
jgi:DNA-binding PadR family transcriptional regulator